MSRTHIILSPKLFDHDKAEITKTFLHELHRLNFSEVVKTNTIHTNSASTTTREAFEFAEEAFEIILNK